MYMHNNHCRWATAHLQLNIIIIRGSITYTKLFLCCYAHGLLHIFENTDSKKYVATISEVWNKIGTNQPIAHLWY